MENMKNYTLNKLGYSLLPDNYFDNKNGREYRFRIAEDILKTSNLSIKHIDDLEITRLYSNSRNITMYIHVPWCVEKCTYCYYWGKVEGRTKMQMLLDAELKHLDMIDEKIDLHSKIISSIYFGGGTPTVLTEDLLEKMFEGFVAKYANRVSTEVCSEASISSLTDEKISILKRYVSRLSIGVQSFNDKILSSVARSFTADKAKAVLKKVIPEFKSVNIDLIYGLRNQTFQDWKETIMVAVTLGVQSVTLYRLEIRVPLMLAEFNANPKAFPGEMDCQSMRYWAKEYLKDSGYRENLVGWFVKPMDVDTVVYRERWQNQTPCIAFGPGVHNYGNNYFYYNTKDANAYIASVNEKSIPIAEFYQFGLKEEFIWYCIAQWKSNVGICLLDLRRKFQISDVDKFLEIIDKFHKWGLVMICNDNCLLTDSGRSLLEWMIKDIFSVWWVD